MSVAEHQRAGERRAWTGERGSLSFVRPSDEVALLVLDGKLEDEAAAAWTEHFPWVVERAKLLFMDGSAVSFASARFISVGTTTINQARPRLERIEVLVGGGLIEMMAKTANLALGGAMQITRERARFEDSLRRLL